MVIGQSAGSPNQQRYSGGLAAEKQETGEQGQGHGEMLGGVCAIDA